MTKRVKAIDLSVVLTVSDAEDYLGRDIRRLAETLRATGTAFEILAMNDGCRDNSFALLALLSAQIPELRVMPGDVSGRAFLRGAALADGGTVVLMDAALGDARLHGLGWALSRLTAGRELVVLRGRFIVARRLPALAALARARGRADVFERNLERESEGLKVEIFGTRRRRSASSVLLGPVLRFLAA